MESDCKGALVPINESEKRNAQEILEYAKVFQDELEDMGRRIKQCEDNIKNMAKEKLKLDEEVIDLQVEVGNFIIKPCENQSDNDTEIVKQNIITQHRSSAAGTLLQLNPESYVSLKRSVIGVVATLGKFKDHNLSRVVSEFLGIETMLAIVCTSHKSIDILEASLGRDFDGQVSTFFLDDIRLYRGKYILKDTEKRLDLDKPRSQNGGFSCGFLGFAVNMIIIEREMLSNVGGCDYGLRESLFYNLLSHLQVYDTKENMLNALPLISNGAVSLDGAMVRSPGVFSPCSWNDLNVKDSNYREVSFPTKIESALSTVEKKNEEKIIYLTTILQDINSEEELLRLTKKLFEEKKSAFLEFLSISSLYTAR